MRFNLPTFLEKGFTSALDRYMMSVNFSDVGLIELKADVISGIMTVIIEQQFAEQLTENQISNLWSIACKPAN
jgi:hypothetical protein